jgi:hypothetical protein
VARTVGRGWEATVRVERRRTTAAPADRAWSLFSRPQAWSVRPQPCMTFDLAAADDLAALDSPAGDMWFYLTAADGAPVAAVLQATAVVPGELLHVGPPGGSPIWELAVESGRRGTVLRAAVIRTVPRQAKIDAEVYIRNDLDAWLSALAAIAEDRRPWPGEDLPPALRQACLAGPSARHMVEASASMDVAASPDNVGQALVSVDVLRAVLHEQVVTCGYISGTPAGEVGGVRYSVYRHGENLRATASLIAAVSPNAVITRQITTPFAESNFSWAVGPGGTRLDLTQRFPVSAATLPDEQMQALEAAVAGLAARYKAAIESWPG